MIKALDITVVANTVQAVGLFPRGAVLSIVLIRVDARPASRHGCRGRRQPHHNWVRLRRIGALRTTLVFAVDELRARHWWTSIYTT